MRESALSETGEMSSRNRHSVLSSDVTVGTAPHADTPKYCQNAHSRLKIDDSTAGPSGTRLYVKLLVVLCASAFWSNAARRFASISVATARTAWRQSVGPSVSMYGL